MGANAIRSLLVRASLAPVAISLAPLPLAELREVLRLPTVRLAGLARLADSARPPLDLEALAHENLRPARLPRARVGRVSRRLPLARREDRTKVDGVATTRRWGAGVAHFRSDAAGARECKILDRIGRDRTHKDIAAELDVSINTVANLAAKPRSSRRPNTRRRRCRSPQLA